MKLTVGSVVFLALVACGDQVDPEALVTAVAEPPGAHCAAGGEAIQSGIDRDGDGKLESSEITATSYVCAGADGQQPLVRIDDEPAGSHCAAGGSAVHVGLDTNGDQVLEDSEIETTSYLCRAGNPTTITGSFVVRNSIDAAQLVGVTAITGNLDIDAVGLTSIDLSALHTLGGTLTVTGFSGTVLGLPALSSAGHLYVGSQAAAEIAAPALTTVGNITLSNYVGTTVPLPALTTAGDIMISGAPHLTSLSFPAITSAGAIGIQACNALASFSAPQLATASNVSVSWDPALTSFEVDSLASVASVSFGNVALTTLALPHITTLSSLNLSGMPVLASVDFSNLTAVTWSLYIESDPVLTALSFPALTSVSSLLPSGGAMYISDNALLSSFSAPSWTSFGPTPATANVQVGFYSNPHLPSCEIQGLLAQIQALNAFQWGNDDGASCP